MKKSYKIFIGSALLCLAHSANALVMDFGSGIGNTQVTDIIYSEDGMTMTPVHDGTGGWNHWDWFQDTHGANSTDWHAAIHSGNNGGDVRFDFGGAAFDLNSIFVEGIIAGAGGVASVDALFTASNGSTYTLLDPSSGTVDFTTIAGFSNITYFTIDIVNPSYEGSCSAVNAVCTTFMFDDVDFQAHVPSGQASAPATLGFNGLGISRSCETKKKMILSERDPTIAGSRSLEYRVTLS